MTKSAAPSALVYPCGDPPGPGQAHVIAPGVRWLRMAMPFALNHINLWAVVDQGAVDAPSGWAVIDTGLQTMETANATRKGMAGG